LGRHREATPGGRWFVPLLVPLFRDVRRVDEEVYETRTLATSGALFEEVSRGFDGAYLLGDGGGYPLIQGDAVFFSETLGGLFDGVGKLEWICCFVHGCTFLSI
jgi:hypothetical protein